MENVASSSGNNYPVTGYISDIMHVAFGNLPGLIGSLSRSRNISSKDAIAYLQTEIRDVLRRAESSPGTASGADSRLLVELRAEVDFLQRLYRDRNSKINELQAKVANLRAELNFTRKKIADGKNYDTIAETDGSRDETASLRDKLIKSNDELTIARQEKAQADDEVRQCREELRQVKRQIEQSRDELLRQCETDRRNFEALESLNLGFSGREKELLNLVKTVYPQVASPKDAIRNLKLLVTQYRDQARMIEDLTRAKDEQAKLTNDALQRLAEATSTSRTNEAAIESVNALTAEIARREECEKRLVNLQLRVDEGVRRERTLENLRAQLAGRTEIENERLGVLEADINHCREESKGLRAQLQAVQLEHDDSQTALTSTLRDLRRNKELNRELEQRVAELSASEKQFQRIKDLMQEATEACRARGKEAYIDPELLRALLFAYYGENVLTDIPNVPSVEERVSEKSTPKDSVPEKPLPREPKEPPLKKPKLKRKKLMPEAGKTIVAPEREAVVRKKGDGAVGKIPRKMSVSKQVKIPDGTGPNYPSREFITTSESDDDDVKTETVRDTRNDAKTKTVRDTYKGAIPSNRGAGTLSEKLKRREEERRRQQLERRRLGERLAIQTYKPDFEDLVFDSDTVQPTTSTADSIEVTGIDANKYFDKDYDISGGDISENEHVLIVSAEESDENAELYAAEMEEGTKKS